MILFLVIYAICALVTVMIIGLIQGMEQGRIRVIQPQTFSTLNGPNVLALGLIWPAYWMAVYGRKRVSGESKTEAALGLGISPEKVA
jgi:hypothetical protein